MDYIKLHTLLVQKFTERNWKHKRFHRKGVEPPCIVEAHHVLPKSIGGQDNDSNIVVVTPREHFILHKLLTKIRPCRQTYSALAAMRCSRKGNRLTSRQMEDARKAYIVARKRPLDADQLAAHHRLHLGKRRSQETCRKISESLKGKTSWSKGKKLTKDQRLGMRKPKTITNVTCPHCGKTGARHGMSRYHFDNCKLAPARD